MMTVMLENKLTPFPPSMLELDYKFLPQSKKSTANYNIKTPAAKKENTRRRKENENVIEIDDDFGMLFDWVTHLDDNDLGDFHEVEVAA